MTEAQIDAYQTQSNCLLIGRLFMTAFVVLIGLPFGLALACVIGVFYMPWRFARWWWSEVKCVWGAAK